MVMVSAISGIVIGRGLFVLFFVKSRDAVDYADIIAGALAAVFMILISLP
jgi:hypothetical protein